MKHTHLKCAITCTKSLLYTIFSKESSKLNCFFNFLAMIPNGLDHVAFTNAKVTIYQQFLPQIIIRQVFRTRFIQFYIDVPLRGFFVCIFHFLNSFVLFSTSFSVFLTEMDFVSFIVFTVFVVSFHFFHLFVSFDSFHYIFLFKSIVGIVTVKVSLQQEVETRENDRCTKKGNFPLKIVTKSVVSSGVGHVY